MIGVIYWTRISGNWEHLLLLIVPLLYSSSKKILIKEETFLATQKSPEKESNQKARGLPPTQHLHKQQQSLSAKTRTPSQLLQTLIIIYYPPLLFGGKKNASQAGRLSATEIMKKGSHPTRGSTTWLNWKNRGRRFWKSVFQSNNVSVNFHTFLINN